MRKLDESTLEALAESICGSGAGAGGGYDSPGPHRTMGQVNEFFRRAGVRTTGGSSTRKWFALESLQAVNGTRGIEGVLLRLASPKEYRGDADVTRKVIDYLNQVLLVEGLEITLVGINARIQDRTAAVAPPKPKDRPVETAPNFARLVADSSLADILSFRWGEAQRCIQAEAYLSAVIMMGSILEGALLYKAEQNLETVNRAQRVPRRRDRSPKPIHEWGMSALIDVSHEVNWLHGDVKRFSHALRESRNIVHPYVQRLHQDRPDAHTCAICWQVVRAAVADLLGID